MGRKPSRNKNLPQGMRARHRTSGTYYYLDTSGTPRREIALGSDYALAVKKWAELTVNAQPRHTELITFRYDRKNVMGTEGRVRANREKALFSHIWTLHVSGASLQSLIPVQAYAATKRLDEIPILMTRPIRQSLQLLIFQRDRQWNSLI